MASTMNRRALIGGAGLAAVSVAASTALATAAPIAASTPEWDALYRDFHAAAARSRAAMDVYAKAETGHNSRLYELGDKPTKPASPPLDTSLSLAAIIEQTNDPEQRERWDDYERRLAEWEARRKALQAETLDDAEDEWNREDSAAIALAARIRAYPVSTLFMLSQKASSLHGFFDGQLEAHDAAALVADIRRLAGEA